MRKRCSICQLVTAFSSKLYQLIFLDTGLIGSGTGPAPKTPTNTAAAVNLQQKRRSSTRSIKRKKFDDELVESSLVKSDRGRLKVTSAMPAPPATTTAAAVTASAAAAAPVLSVVPTPSTILPQAPVPPVPVIAPIECKVEPQVVEVVPAAPPPEKKKVRHHSMSHRPHSIMSNFALKRF